MHPFVVITAGLGLVVFDVRTEVLDLAADPLGWGLVAYGAWALALPRASGLAGLTAILSLPELQLPYHWVEVDPITGVEHELPAGSRRGTHIVFETLSGWRLGLVVAATLTAGATLWTLLTGLEHQARTRSPAGPARELGVLRLASVGLWIVPLLVVLVASIVGEEGFDPVWNGNRSYLTLLGLLPLVGLGLLLCLHAGRAWAQPDRDAPRPSPWAALRARN